MTTRTNTRRANGKSSPASSGSEDVIRQLEQFPVEVLEAALLVLQMREAKARQ